MSETRGHRDYALAMDTSTAQGGLALGRGATIREVCQLTGPKKHAADFLPAMAALCDRHEVSPSHIARIYVAIGPGSFTGLRIGVTAARMMAFACNATITAVGTLEVIAQNAAEVPAPPGRVVVILDAKRQRVYAATFRRRRKTYESESAPAEVDPRVLFAGMKPDCAVLGEGVRQHLDAVQASGLTVLPEALFAPRPDVLYRLGRRRANKGEVTERHALVPLYVRPPEAEERWAQRQAARPGP